MSYILWWFWGIMNKWRRAVKDINCKHWLVSIFRPMISMLESSRISQQSLLVDFSPLTEVYSLHSFLQLPLTSSFLFNSNNMYHQLYLLWYLDVVQFDLIKTLAEPFIYLIVDIGVYNCDELIFEFLVLLIFLCPIIACILL